MIFAAIAAAVGATMAKHPVAKKHIHNAGVWVGQQAVNEGIKQAGELLVKAIESNKKNK